jgi:hypothetical protein
MKCLSCDVILTDFEATRKSVNTGEYIDLCNNCFDTVKDDFEVLEREELRCIDTLEPELDSFLDDIE